MRKLKKKSSAEEPVLSPPIAQLTSAKSRMETMSTKKMNVVPQRSCMREHFFTFSTVRGMPIS